MRDTLRDFTLAVGAAAALFAGFQAWQNGKDLAEVRGAVNTITTTVTAHVSAAGLHR